MIAADQSLRAQQVGQGVATRLELGVGHGLSAAGHDEGGLVRPRRGMPSRIHGCLPGCRQANPRMRVGFGGLLVRRSFREEDAFAVLTISQAVKGRNYLAPANPGVVTPQTVSGGEE